MSQQTVSADCIEKSGDNFSWWKNVLYIDNITFLHWYKIERAIPGPSPGVSDQTFPGPEYNFLLWA